MAYISTARLINPCSCREGLRLYLARSTMTHAQRLLPPIKQGLATASYQVRRLTVAAAFERGPSRHGKHTRGERGRVHVR